PLRQLAEPGYPRGPYDGTAGCRRTAGSDGGARADRSAAATESVAARPGRLQRPPGTAGATPRPRLRPRPGAAADRGHLRSARDREDVARRAARASGPGVVPGRSDLPGHARRD